MKRLALLLLILTGVIPAYAQLFFTEKEPNDSLAQAQFLDTKENKFVVFGDRTTTNRSADWYRVWGSKGTRVDFVVNTTGGSFMQNDPIFGLFDSTGRELVFNDNLLGPYGLDAGVLNYYILNSGYYYVAVSAHGDRNFRGGGGSGRDSIWRYNLGVVRTTVPEPSEWAVISLSVMGVGGLMFRASRRSKIS
ncbi:MAG: hypothetical protein QM758_03970 [Armatimonas sp.]